MTMVDRIKGILISPKEEWPRIAAEPATVQSLYTGYIVILAVLGPIGAWLNPMRGGFGFGIVLAVVSYLITLAITYVVALIVDALAPSFDGEKDLTAALKLVAYSMTAAWVGGFFQIIPMLGGLISIVAALYSVYLFYLGAPVLRKCGGGKAVGFTIVVALCVIVLQILIAGALVASLIGGVGGMGAMMPR